MTDPMTTPSPQPTAESAQPHKHGWNYGYVTCSCGWAWDSCKKTETGRDMDTNLGMKLFNQHLANVAPPAESERPKFEDNYSEAAAFAGITFSQACQFDMYMKYLLGKGPKPGFLVSERPSMSTEKVDFSEWWNRQGHLFMAGNDVSVQRAVMGLAERAFYAGSQSALLKPQGETPEGGRKAMELLPHDFATSMESSFLTLAECSYCGVSAASLAAAGSCSRRASLPPSEPVSPQPQKELHEDGCPCRADGECSRDCCVCTCGLTPVSESPLPGREPQDAKQKLREFHPDPVDWMTTIRQLLFDLGMKEEMSNWGGSFDGWGAAFEWIRHHVKRSQAIAAAPQLPVRPEDK